MPKHLRNDHTLKSLLPWFALLGFLGIAMYVLLPVDFWLPEHKSRHHTVIKEEAATQLEDDLFIDGFPIEVDEPIASTPEPSPSETEAKAPITASGAEPPKAVPPSTQAEPKPPITVSGAEPPKAVPPSTQTEPKLPITAGGTEPPKAVPPSTQAEPKPPITAGGAEPPKAVPPSTQAESKPPITASDVEAPKTAPPSTQTESKPPITASGSEQSKSSPPSTSIASAATGTSTAKKETPVLRDGFIKRYKKDRVRGNYWQQLAKGNFNPTLIAQLEPLKIKLEDPSVNQVELLYADYVKDGKTNPENSKIIAVRLSMGKEKNTYYARIEGKNVYYYDDDGRAPEAAMDRIPLTHYDYISSPFDPERRHPITHIIRPHEGTDFKAAYGSPIHATADGIVNYADWQGGYGKLIIIDHDNGYQTRYAHLADIQVKVGDQVKRGQTIASLGNSGMSTGAHLHYEVRIDDIPHDPMTVSLPSSKPLPKNYKDAWHYRCDQYSQEMDSLAQQQKK